MIGRRDVRPLVAALAAAVVIVGAALFTLPDRQGAAAPAAAAVPGGAASAGDPPVVAQRAALPETGVEVEAYQVFGGKNPFERPGAPGQISTTTSPGTGTTLPGATTSTFPTTSFFFPTTTTGGGTITTITPGTAPVRGTTVAVLDVYAVAGERTATIRVNGLVYVVKEGDVVAGTLRVVAIDLATECVDFLFGDRRFRLCVGQEIIK
jgi:8-oxo-dGTP pyrophosphatase MutT (NUDIX family)